MDSECTCGRNKRNPLNLLMSVSKLTLRLEKFRQILGSKPFGTSTIYTDVVTKLVDRTGALPSVPSPGVFGMYLENFMTISSVHPYSETGLEVPILVLDELTEFYLAGGVGGAGSHPHLQELRGLAREIHATLRATVLHYIGKHKPNKTTIYRSVRQFLSIMHSVMAASYSTPSLSSPFFNECLSGLDKFCWKLQRTDLDSLTIPRWAALKEDCDLPDFNIYRTAALEVGLIVSGYAGSVLPQFAGIRSTTGGELGEELDILQAELDPFGSDSEKTWKTYALLLGKQQDYFLWEGHL